MSQEVPARPRADAASALLRCREARGYDVARLSAPWRSGYAAACKAVYTGSIPVGASRRPSTLRSAMVAARRSTARLALLVIGAAITVWLVVSIIAGWSLNPFGTETKDRSQPVLLKSLESLSEYRAATANMQEIVDVEEDVKLLPSFIAGEKALLVAAGTVDAAVDFRALQERGSVKVSEDRESVEIVLPPAALSEARVDLEKSRVVDTDRGIVNRVGDAFSDDTNEERELLLLAQRKIEEAARQDPALLQLAERNTRAMLTGMLRGLGFERITIRFTPPPT